MVQIDANPSGSPPPAGKTSAFGCIALILVVITGVVLVSVFGLKSCDQTNYVYKSDAIGVVSYSLGTSVSGSPAITGKAVNISGRNLSSATIVFSLYDTSGNVIGTASDTIQDLKSGQSWSFTCEITVQNMSRFSIKEIIVS